MNKILVMMGLMIALVACTPNPEAAAEGRANLIAKIFPDPADRQGLYLVFPLESGGLYDTLLITHFQDEVGQAEVVRRVANYCAGLGSSRLTGQASVVKQMETSTRPRPDGTTGTTLAARYDCVAA